MGGGVVRTTARRDFLEFGTRVTIHQPIDVRSVHASTGFAPNINEVHMLDADGNAVQQINRIRITKWEEKWPRYISPYGSRLGVEITSLFGYRIPSGRTPQFHAGWDFATGRGTKLYSIADGGVVRIRRNGNGFGHHIVIEYDDPKIGKFCALYGHMDKQSTFSVGDKVEQWDEVGVEGDSDSPGAVHLHFQMWRGTELDYGTVSTIFNPLKLIYNLEMSRSGIDNSGLFKLRESHRYGWERAFLNRLDNRTDPSIDIEGTLSRRAIMLNNQEIIDDKRRILDGE